MQWRRLVVCVAIPALLPVIVGAATRATAETGEPSTATCTAYFRDTISPPGVTLAPTSFTLSTGGETGVIDCIGSVQGAPVTGPGQIGDDGSATGTCVSGSGMSKLSMTIPTTKSLNTKVTVGPFPISYLAGTIFRSNDAFPGVATFVPTKGTCLPGDPITQIAVSVQGTLNT